MREHVDWRSQWERRRHREGATIAFAWGLHERPDMPPHETTSGKSANFCRGPDACASPPYLFGAAVSWPLTQSGRGLAPVAGYWIATSMPLQRVATSQIIQHACALHEASFRFFPWSQDWSRDGLKSDARTGAIEVRRSARASRLQLFALWSSFPRYHIGRDHRPGVDLWDAKTQNYLSFPRSWRGELLSRATVRRGGTLSLKTRCEDSRRVVGRDGYGWRRRYFSSLGRWWRL